MIYIERESWISGLREERGSGSEIEKERIRRREREREGGRERERKRDREAGHRDRGREGGGGVGGEDQGRGPGRVDEEDGSAEELRRRRHALSLSASLPSSLPSAPLPSLPHGWMDGWWKGERDINLLYDVISVETSRSQRHPHID